MKLYSSIPIDNIKLTHKHHWNTTAESIPFSILWASYTSISIFKEIWYTNTLNTIKKSVWIIACLIYKAYTRYSIKSCSIWTFFTSLIDKKVSLFTNTLAHTIKSLIFRTSHIYNTCKTIKNKTHSTCNRKIIITFISIPIGTHRTHLTDISSNLKISLVTDTSIINNIKCWKCWTHRNHSCWFFTFSTGSSSITIIAFTRSTTPILILSTSSNILATTSNKW